MKKTAEQIAEEQKEYQDFLADDGLDDEEDFVPSPVEGTQPSAQNQSEESDSDSDEELAELESITKGDEANAAGKPEEAAAKPVETPSEPVADPAAQEVKVETPPVIDPTQAAPAAPAATPAPAEETPTPSAEEIGDVFKNWRSTTEDLLANHHYNLSQEEVEELELEPARFIPKFAARVYLDAVSAAIGQITTHMPAIVRAVNEQERANSETENAFFERWPKLKEHMPQVLQIGQTFRNQNPKASMEDFITNVGAMAMVSLRLDPSAPVAPAAQQAQGFVPAAQTPVGGTPKKLAESNPFTRLDEEFYMEDLD